MEKWPKCKTDQHSDTFGGFLGLGPPPEGPGGCLGRIFGSILEDNGSKMVFFGSSCEMLRHLGAKMANKSAKLEGALFCSKGGGAPPPPAPSLGTPGEGFGRGKDLPLESL